MEIKQETKNDLYKRTEIVFEIEAPKNPSYAEAKKMISDKYKKPEDAVVVNTIKGSFGKNIFSVNAYVYNSKEDLEKAIQKSKKQRVAEKKAIDDAKKAEAEAKKAEAEAKLSIN